MGKTIGFIGLGNMGFPMAKRLLEHGYKIRCYDKNENASSSLQEFGAIASTLSDIVDQSNTIILMLPHSQIVNEVIKQLTTIYSSYRYRKEVLTIIDMSSSFPLDTRNNAEELAVLGIQLLDAPVSGGVKKAINGQLTIMVGGPDTVFTDHYDLLRTMGEKIFYTGSSGSGHLIKALNNYLSAAHMLATCEAVHILSQFGVDPKIGVDVFNHSSGKSISTDYKFPQFILNGQFNSGFSLELHKKDIGIAKELLDHMGDSTPLMKLLYDTYTQAKDDLGGQPDHTEIFRFVSTYTTFNKGDSK
ncbi:NAD(P)-dependent oxidoreductase [Ammoniphilus resinae]|uniref:3-hydroxyisobutyrate dehydrogenase n=1 Tax=Ammoniphilus resinae TaxID=861532 RepID=A0ABS4GLC3_9BACL|nr:NAD(P)-dependent oxidoreductase [Ammoniphilus resinae]MBP1931063.1 3-hydroxyisobutyrate dehydrogenase [Ammoniphilus resinae]